MPENEQSVEEQPREHATLFKALIAAQGRAKAVAKKAKNTHHGYNYASADAIIDEASETLAAEGLGVLPVSVDRDPTQVDHVWQKAVLVKDGVEVDDSWIIIPRRIRAVYKLIHGSGEEHVFECSTPVIPEKGRPEDKAEYGARTEILGYALRDLLLIPREDMAQNTPSSRDDRGFQNRGPAPKAPPASASPPSRPQNGGQQGPKAQTTLPAAASAGPSPGTSAAAPAAEPAPANETTVEAEYTEAHEKRLRALFLELKGLGAKVSGPGAESFIQKITGVTRENLTGTKAERVIKVLEDKIARKDLSMEVAA